jgi:hypothetical protein
MSWLCIVCAQRHIDREETMGFGICKSCRENIKAKKAKERADMLATKASKKYKVISN